MGLVTLSLINEMVVDEIIRLLVLSGDVWLTLAVLMLCASLHAGPCNVPEMACTG